MASSHIGSVQDQIKLRSVSPAAAAVIAYLNNDRTEVWPERAIRIGVPVP